MLAAHVLRSLVRPAAAPSRRHPWQLGLELVIAGISGLISQGTYVGII
jgi:hypothetical protein